MEPIETKTEKLLERVISWVEDMMFLHPKLKLAVVALAIGLAAAIAVKTFLL